MIPPGTYTGVIVGDTINSSVIYVDPGASFASATLSLSGSGGVYWRQVGTLTGKTITMGNGAYIYVSGANNAVTLDSTTTVSGDVSIYSDGSAGTAITNQGTLTHTVGSGQLYAASFTNAGAINATAGTLYLGYPSAGYNSTNTGTVTSDGASTTVYLRGNFDNNGTLTAQNSGTLLWDGDNTTANLGSVVLSGGGRALLNGTINNTAANLTAPTGGTFQLYGGTITGGTIDSNALSFTTSGGYLSGATITGDLTLNTASSYVRFTNGSTFSGANATFGSSAGVYWQQVGTLTGKAITMNNGSYLYVSGVGSALTLDSTTTVNGDVSIYSDGSASTAITNQGTLTHSLGSGQIYASNFTNAGTINATGGTLYLGYPSAGYNSTNTGTVTSDGASTTVYLRGNFDNNGTLTAQNSGTLLWDGDNTTANLGSVVLSGGGRALLNGTLDNTAANLTAPTGGSFQLYGGTITGGTIASNALSFTTSGGYLSGATITGDLTLGTASSYVRFTNGSTFSGANATFGSSAGVYWQQVGTLTGKAITMGSGSYFYVSGANNAVTLDSTTTVNGDVSIYSDGSASTAITNQGTLTHTLGSGQIYASNFTNAGTINATAGTLYLGYPSAGYNSTNTGTVTSDGASTTVYLRGNFDNNGTLTAQNSGTLLWDGDNTTANLGSVVLSGGGRALLNGTLDNTAANLTAPTGGTFQLYGGTITGGTIDSSALSFTTSGGYLSGASLTGNLTLATTSSYVRFTNNANFTGASASLAASSGIYWQQVGTLTGKAITMGSGSYLYVSGANNAVTLDSTTTVNGDVSIYSDGSAGTAITNQGTLTHTVGTGQIYASNFTNAGTISATAGTLYLGYPSAGYNSTNTGSVTSDGASTTVYLRGNFDNNGTLTAQNSGTLLWDGDNTTANLGSVVLSGGGRALLNGTINNTAANLTAPTGGSYQLYGGTISGGTIDNSALSFTTSGGYLSGASLTGNLTLATTSSYVRFTNNANFTGTSASLAANTGIYWQQVGTLTGKTITQGSGAYLYVTGTGNSLTLDATTTASGTVSIYSDGSAGTVVTNQGTVSHDLGTGQIYASNFTNAGTINATGGTLYLGYPSASYTATNTGSVTSDGASTTVYLRGNFDNNGTLTAQNSGTLLWDGSNTTANLGNVVLATGGRARLNGTLDNASATLNAPTGGAFDLYGGTITGGTVASGALAFTTSGGYLDGVSLTGNLNLSVVSSYVRFTNGTGFSGTDATLASSTGLYWQQAGTFSGKTVTMGTNSFIYINGVNNTLTLDPTTTVAGNVAIYSDGSTGTTLTNQGTITNSTGSGQLYARSFVNSGSITATGGSLTLGTTSTGYTATNAAGATILLNGGNITVYAPTGNPFLNQGTLHVQSGTLFAGNYLQNGGTGLVKGAGTINGDLTLAGGTLAPGNSIGTLTMVNSDFAVTGSSVFEIEMDGTTSDRLTFQNPTSAVNIGAGLLALSINLLAAPTQGTTYTIMNISSGGSGITGYFNNLPNNGDALIANFGGTDYTLNVYYLGNSITLQVPEPSTYALMGAGLAVFALRLRRRRR